jgi:RNA polymerase sigma factor (sigma-70 family)
MNEELPPESRPLPSMIELYRRDVRQYPDSHLDLPIKIAYGVCARLPKFWPYLMDFIQEGNLELLRCVKVFNEQHPDEDNGHFRNYAASCIRGVVYHYFSRIPDIYIPSASRHVLFQKKERHEELEILECLISWEALCESMVEIEEPTTMQMAFCDAKRERVQTLLSALPAKEKHLISLRYGLNGMEHNHEEVAYRLDISIHHTRELEKQAIQRMNGTCTKQSREQGIQQRKKERMGRLQEVYDQHQGNIKVRDLARLARCGQSMAIKFLHDQGALSERG